MTTHLAAWVAPRANIGTVQSETFAPMKTKLPVFAFLGLVAAGAALAAGTDKPVSRIEVIFVDPQKFTDVNDESMATESGRDYVLEQLKSHMLTVGSKYVNQGQRLEIKVSDIDLAGAFEPWRGVDFGHIRIIKDIYPPRMTLEFRLVDADGKVLSTGTRQLSDFGFMMTISLPTNDPLRYDKGMISDWMRREFKPRS